MLGNLGSEICIEVCNTVRYISECVEVSWKALGGYDTTYAGGL